MKWVLLGLLSLILAWYLVDWNPSQKIETPAQVKTGDKCATVLFYYYGETHPLEVSLEDQCTISIERLKQIAEEKCPSRPISRFVTRVGVPIGESYQAWSEEDGVDDLGVQLILGIDEGDQFLFPATRIGETFNVTIFGRLHHFKTIATSPRIFEIIGLLNNTETDHFAQIVEQQREKMERSKVGETHDVSKTTDVRTSSHHWVGYDKGHDRWYRDEITDTVEDRIYELTRLPEDVGEAVQVVWYRQNEHYFSHHDYNDPVSNANNPYTAGGGNRLVTLLLYFNEPEEGGETAFPFVTADGLPRDRDLDPTSLYSAGNICERENILKLSPKKGRAVLFYSLEERGHQDKQVDKWSLHSGCPVKKGEKFIANKWIRNKRVDGKLFSGEY